MCGGLGEIGRNPLPMPIPKCENAIAITMKNLELNFPEQIQQNHKTNG